MTYNIGPKLGDFIHGLVIPKYIYETTGKKAHIYISNDGCTFTTGLNKTYEELRPILEKQDYVEKFSIHNGETVDFNVPTFRGSRFLFSGAWSEVYFSLLDLEVPKNYRWLSYETPSTGEVVMNRSMRSMSPKTKEWYETFLDGNNVKFIFSEQAQYDSFPFKNKVRPSYCPTLEDMVREIAGAKMYIGNQSSPTAIASALNIPRIIELRKTPDAPHYREEMKYNDNITVFNGD